MFCDSDTSRIHRHIITRLTRAFLDGSLDQLDRLPIEMRPKEGAFSRCCVYKDRAMIKYRCMATLGIGIEEETDELTTLREYAEVALTREKIQDPILTVISEGCSGCVQAHYEITNGCHGCFARPCVHTCPKKAISIKNGKAEIDFDLCIRCGKCQKVCPYHAIIDIPVPCEESCPTGAIRKKTDTPTNSEPGKTIEPPKVTIDFAKCIFCGKCVISCPFGAIMEKSEIVDVLKRLDRRNKDKVVALIAPSIIGQFNATVEALAGALKKIGFAEVAEVAAGADETCATEADEFVRRMEDGQPFMTSSCCFAYDEFVKKSAPELKDKVSETPTPMHLTARKVKDAIPDATTVFIGPCVAKRAEALGDDMVDFVLTFEELAGIFDAFDVDVEKEDESDLMCIGGWRGRGFPVSGGTTEAIKSNVAGRHDMTPVMIDGLDRKNGKLLKTYAKGNCPGNFIEVMACEGGCVAGPGMIQAPEKATRRIKQLVEKKEESEKREVKGKSEAQNPEAGKS